MSEQPASHPHQGEDTCQLLSTVSCGEIDALVAENTLDDALPSEEMEVGPARLGANELVPEMLDRAAPDMRGYTHHGRGAHATGVQ